MAVSDHGHGGPRPKTRHDDGRLNNRPSVHPGRQPKAVRLKAGDQLRIGQRTPEGLFVEPIFAKIIQVERNLLTLQASNGDTITLSIARADAEE